MINAKLAKSARIIAPLDGGEASFEIDGEDFPWYIGQAISVDTSDSDMTTVTVQIIVDGPVILKQGDDPI